MSHASNYTSQAARKAHICDWCGTSIEPGERYAKWTWFEDGTATTVRSHDVCREAANRTRYPDEVWYNRDQPKGCDCGFGRMCCGKEKP